MNTCKKIIFLSAILAMPALGGCTAPLPRSAYSPEIARVFNASFDRTWEAVLEVINNSKGTVITRDRSSGLIVFSMPEEGGKSLEAKRVYMNVHIKDVPSNAVMVYAIPRAREGREMFAGDIPGGPFGGKLTFIKDGHTPGFYETAADKVFFEKLETILNQQKIN